MRSDATVDFPEPIPPVRATNTGADATGAAIHAGWLKSGLSAADKTFATGNRHCPFGGEMSGNGPGNGLEERGLR
jgi:hypothetical protein